MGFGFQTGTRVSVVVDPSLRTQGVQIYAPQRVLAMVRQALVGWGLGRNCPDVPLSDLIRPGDQVLLKPNWVVDWNAGPGGLECLYTHQSVIMAILKETLAARPGRVIIGDAPIQSCEFGRLISPSLRSQVQALAHDAGVIVEIVDFRRTVMSKGAWDSSVETERRDARHFVLFDLGPDSLVDPISSKDCGFRVADYDHRELARTHSSGKHQYLLCREAFEADVVISLPKLKTHSKAGLTGALKNLVGLNGNKDFLPHYRRGGSDLGGDCYEGWSLHRDLSERFDDVANKRLNQLDYPLWKTTARGLRLLSGGGGRMGGAWHGNDTVWRMVLDLNRILVYGNRDGAMCDSPQRAFFSLTDALIAGEGDGPLRPSPLVVGAVTFGGSPVACDLVHAAMLRLDAARIPLLRESLRPFRWPLASANDISDVLVNGERLTCQQLAERYGMDARPPAGWKGRVEWKSVRTAGVKDKQDCSIPLSR